MILHPARWTKFRRFSELVQFPITRREVRWQLPSTRLSGSWLGHSIQARLWGISL